MANRIITISRQFGSGGRTIGKRLAETLGIPCYDQELIEKIAEESGLAKDFIRENSEYTQSGSFLASAFTSRNLTGYSLQDELWLTQCRIIRDIAEKESCVIVGRCADYILRNDADLLRVYIYSDMDKRAQRIVEQYGESSENPEKRLRDKDKRRKTYYQFYTDLTWGDPANYDICLNSGVIGLDHCVDILATLY